MNKVRAGELSFDCFARETKDDWRRLGASLFRRWKLPDAVELEDLVQELLFGAWLAIPEWSAGKGTKIERFVVWQAMNAAKCWLHVQRGASKHGNRDKNASRFDFAAGDMFDDSGMEMPTIEATQEQVVLGLERLRMATKLLYTEKERRAFVAVVETGSVEAALVVLAARGQSMPRRAVVTAVRQVALQIEEQFIGRT